MIAVAFALPAESSEFLRRHGRDVPVLHTGVGPQIASARMRAFLAENPKPRLLLSAGFVGALDPSLQVGELFLADNFDPAAARALLPEAQVGKLASTLAVTDSAAARSALAAKTGARAVDMETEALAAECARAGVPLLSLRVITDTPAHPLPAPPHVLFDLERQRTPALRLAFYLATHPAAIPRLLAFAQEIAAARISLTNGLDRLLAGL